LANRDTILTVVGYYISISLQLFEVELEERETWITKDVILGLSVFVVRFS